MKKIILLATIISYAATEVTAQHNHGSHQKQAVPDRPSETVVKGTGEQGLSPMLTAYYNIKNALISGDAASAATNAEQFLRITNAMDFKVISEGNLHILAKDAGNISGTTDIKKQRDYFVNLSTNMAAVAKAVNLASQPVYLQYCPMKKASWLSSEKEIRNPYYGSTMLTCGNVIETISQIP